MLLSVFGRWVDESNVVLGISSSSILPRLPGADYLKPEKLNLCSFLVLALVAVFKGRSKVFFFPDRDRVVHICKHHWQNWCQHAVAQPQNMSLLQKPVAKLPGARSFSFHETAQCDSMYNGRRIFFLPQRSFSPHASLGDCIFGPENPVWMAEWTCEAETWGCAHVSRIL